MLLDWLAAFCESQRQFLAIDELRAVGLEAFCPFEWVTERKRQRGGRFTVVKRRVPVFGSYIFVRADGHAPQAVSSARGVFGVVSSRGSPLVIPDYQIARLKSTLDEDGSICARDLTKRSYTFRAKVGDVFTFKTDSPLAGLFGQIADLSKLDETGVVKAFIEMLGAKRLIDVSCDSVRLGDLQAA